jgi:hypothetical protein
MSEMIALDRFAVDLVNERGTVRQQHATRVSLL